MNINAPIKVSVTAEDILEGVCGDCHRCAVALALSRASGDDEANVYERDWTLYLEVHGRHIPAPFEVSQFVRTFDSQPRTDGGAVDFDAVDCEPPSPFDFELPPFDGGDWQERCYHCEELFDDEELDDEGICKECLAKAEAEA